MVIRLLPISTRTISKIGIVTTITVFLSLLGTGVLAASVSPVLFDPWTSGDAASECAQAGCSATYAYKIDGWAGNMNGAYPTGVGNTIQITNSDSYTFDWTSTWPVTCVIVKASN